jgi:hypothetical protein
MMYRETLEDWEVEQANAERSLLAQLSPAERLAAEKEQQKRYRAQMRQKKKRRK